MSTVSTTAPVPATAFEPFRVLLETQREECLRQRELALTEAAASVPDPVAVSRAATLLRTIEEIDAALGRIAAGSYGTCVHCGSAIPEERLEFRPFAAGCVACHSPAH
ncbi:TraR/DksA family transcriptional regulator [Modestobacter sp. I12A-02662]|uniref:TraR/DksA family transcriptional regulator n=1 Tax=Modestobacter sp. I12A-02662 TaxID=1730496 RepID=UPI0034DEE7DA